MPCRTTLHTVVAFGGSAVLALALSGCGVLGGSDQPAVTTPATTPVTAPGTTPAIATTTTAPPSADPVVSPSPSVSPVKPAGFTFPVKAKTSFGRTHHDYPATDIFAACGSTVVAPTDGVISEVSLKDTWNRKVNDGATRGGLSFSMVGARGVRYYGSHLRAIAANIRPGVAVTKGEVIGKVGNTGDAASVACHLHFGISPACSKGDWWIRRGRISPYPYLKAWQKGQNLDPAKEIAAWKAKHGCSKTPPKGY
jgi:peptidoglycan LD-endopeptidase LytH